jgi:hypothetical protein
VVKRFQTIGIRGFLLVVVAWIFAPAAFAQTDEIQVYDGALADVGKYNLTLHSNFTPKGINTPAFPGAITSEHSYNGAAEWARGMTSWFELGLYLPLYSVDKDLGPKINGGKIRLLFASPKADDRKFFYGANFEFSFNSEHWDQKRFTSEVRPIIGWHLKPVDIIINPIVDTDYTGGVRNLEFVPATRVAYNLKEWAVGVEEYADYGPLRQFFSAHDQYHMIYGVVDHKVKSWDVEGGVGIGVTAATDKVTLKLILSRDLN